MCAHKPMRNLILAVAVLLGSAAVAQSAGGAAPLQQPSPNTGTLPQDRPVPGATALATSPAAGSELLGLTPGAVQLLTLDGAFSQAVAKGGGDAFVQWFADDAVTLSNGRPPVLTKAGIASSAHWKATEYRLQWLPMGAQMGPSGDMGFTWGHYDATTFAKAGVNETVQSGRYVTVWKRQPDGKWKVALDASADEPKP